MRKPEDHVDLVHAEVPVLAEAIVLILFLTNIFVWGGHFAGKW